MLPIAGVHYLSTIETAAILGVSDSRVRQLVMDRTLIPRRIGARIYFHPRHVEAHRAELELHRNAPRKPRKSYYKRKRLEDYANYKTPAQKQAERKARLIRTRVA